MIVSPTSSLEMGKGANAQRIELESRRLIAAAADQGVVLRLIGGIAVRVHCAGHLLCRGRDYGDIDLVTASRLPEIHRVFGSAGFDPFTRFNALHGHSRAIFYGNQFKADVFLGSFDMCHQLPLGERLEVEELTVPLAELCLTKLQIVRLNTKDVRDLGALLSEHPVGATDDETINGDRIASICSRDWGLYHTVELNLRRVQEEAARLDMPAADRVLLRDRARQLLDGMQAHEKSRKWRVRARLGERVQWYEEPDDVVDAR